MAEISNWSLHAASFDRRDQFWWWRAALEGKKPPTHEDEPMIGYFKVRDDRGINANKIPAKRPWVPAAIWRDTDGTLVGELCGKRVTVEQLWPNVAKHPIPYADYVFFHTHERWPEANAA